MDTSVEAKTHMKTLIVLAREHEAIERIVTRLEHELDTLTRTGELDGEALQRMLEFFEQAVDGHHQESEERVLLPRLLLRAQGDEAALVRSLLVDHGEQRTFLEDGDTVRLAGRCTRDGFRPIGFGPCEATVLPAVQP